MDGPSGMRDCQQVGTGATPARTPALPPHLRQPGGPTRARDAAPRQGRELVENAISTSIMPCRRHRRIALESSPHCAPRRRRRRRYPTRPLQACGPCGPGKLRPAKDATSLDPGFNIGSITGTD